MIPTLILSIGFIIHSFMCFIINKNHLEYHERKDTRQIQKNIEIINYIFELKTEIKKLKEKINGEDTSN